MTLKDLSKKGFTLIELLVVIGILAILMAIVLVAINPSRQFEQANQTKRTSDINAILNAVHQYAADHQGALPFAIVAGDPAVALSSTALEALATGQAETFCTNLVPTYIAALPVDPGLAVDDPIESGDCAGTWDTGYTASVSGESNRITIAHPGSGISVVR